MLFLVALSLASVRTQYHKRIKVRLGLPLF